MAANLGLIVLLIGISKLAETCAPIPCCRPRLKSVPDNFAYLGTYNGIARSGKNVESEYYVTFNSKVPVDAEADCDAVFSSMGGGALVEFEDVQEMDAINKYLQQYGAGYFYWTGGVYDPIDGYYWQQSNNNMNSAVAQFIRTTSPPRKIDQLVFAHDSARRFHMEVKPNANAEAYICEVKRIPRPKCTIAVSDTAHTWSDAKAYCETKGLRLASIDTEEKYQCALQEINKTGLPDATNYWTAATDTQQEGQFVWAGYDSRVTKFFPIGNGQPDNAGGSENCVSLRKIFPSGTKSFHEMNDEICNLNFATLCE